ncbi:MULTISPECIES: lipopolysaccharide transport periplasmic protein LptA [Halocynthiibacter]|uniref:Lipopolysaccharide transport periplasmic protein LptA n=1 Tax=Halocynthiibacter halioticoli TaxID=2986804 RepID=A0AAE3J0J3_9RHOB|nr:MULTISPECIES: lipopolysaccharide transport periplasmic protein LptA [Halocynthiibacter]MCV6825543.1 lipopolysaccharide transport periplasmic protein LptA [Halocynthiibacter halioticoli]MCW4058544.1 lipopolysaccharide transport periplasmic protein LptA [Halocynthiibacter sp. SDUM655004]MDE0590934.1 lipopolysaccharide transport periplasmic protein LptA [Halocynthiibacter sp. C4]
MRAIFAILLFFSGIGPAFAQGTSVLFGSSEHDASLPVEVVADLLEVDQTTGDATFTGNVVVGQGEMRLSAEKVIVEYKTEEEQQASDSSGKINRLIASENVLLVNGPEAAEADFAEYTIDSAEVIMIGNVIVTQGENATSGNRMVVDLNTGRAQMSGRVKTILQPDN